MGVHPGASFAVVLGGICRGGEEHVQYRSIARRGNGEICGAEKEAVRGLELLRHGMGLLEFKGCSSVVSLLLEGLGRRGGSRAMPGPMPAPFSARPRRCPRCQGFPDDP